MTYENNDLPTSPSPVTPLGQRLDPDDFPHEPSAGSNKPPATLENVRHLLEAYGIQVAYCVIKKRVSIRRGDMPLEECDLISLANLNGVGSNYLLDFVGTLARRNETNPVADWIDSKPWDGIDRTPDLFATIEVQEGFPTSIRDALLNRWMLSCVAAAQEPDRFKGRGVLTLLGGQGIGKTSWIGRLVPLEHTNEWIKVDHHLDAHNKDSIVGAMSHWIVEIGELESSFRKDVSRLKGLLTNDCDKLRLPYARSPIELPRRTVFSATVNDPNFLIDRTGNSRWWTIPVEKLDFKHDIDMQQVFAQFAVRYRGGEQWWLTPAEEGVLEEFNGSHTSVSVVEERVRDRIDPDGDKPEYMTATALLEQIGFRTPSNTQAKECGSVLRSLIGPPKRIRGIMKWKVALRSESVWHVNRQDDPDLY